MRAIHWTFGLLTLAATAATGYGQQGNNVDLELALLADTSGSVGATGFNLQKQGYVDAFNSPAIANAIANGDLGRIAVTLVDWDDDPTQAVGWTLIDGSQGQTAGDFATAVNNWSGSAGGGTDMADAINAITEAAADAGVDAFTESGFNGTRQVIDLSTDGSPSDDQAAAQAAADALAGGVETINAIGIEGADVEFLEDNIVGGDGAFLVTAENFEDFAQAILDKLLQEITGGTNQQASVNSARDNVPLQFDVGRQVSFSQWTNVGSRLQNRRGDRQGGVMLVDASRWYMPASNDGTLALANGLADPDAVVPGAQPVISLAMAQQQEQTAAEQTAPGTPTRKIKPWEEERFGVFATGRVIWGQQDLSAGEADFIVGGGTAGMDYRLTNDVVVGLAVGYDNTDVDAPFDGDLDIDAGSVSLYSTWTPTESLYFDGAATYSYLEYHQERRFPSGGGVAQANSDTHAHQFALQGRAGYDFNLGERCVLSPVAGLSWVHSEIDGYTESGPAGLTIEDQDADSLQSRLGLHLSYLGQIGGHPVMPQLRVAWVHEYLDDNRTIHGQFGGTSISFPTDDPDRDFVELGGGIVTRLTESSQLFVNYDAVLGNSEYEAHVVSGGVKFFF